MFPLSEEEKKYLKKKYSQFHKVLKGSLKIKDEKVLIISDYGNKENTLATMFGYGYYHAARNKRLNASILYQEVKKGFMQADAHITAALDNLPPRSVVIVTASNKLGRIGDIKSFRTYCMEQGHRFLSATGLGDVKNMHFELFLEAMNINYKRMQKRGNAIKKQWDKAREIRIKTDAGTDVVFNVDGKKAIANIGQYHEPGSGGNMPAGEVYMPPQGMEGVNGIIVVDGSIKTESGAVLVEEPLKLHIEKGRLVKMEGKHAALLEQTFQKFEDRARYPERVRLACELGMGINPSAVLIGSTIMDEKVLGTAHIAFGSNYWFGGDIHTLFHGDMVFKGPVFYVDGKKMEI